MDRSYLPPRQPQSAGKTALIVVGILAGVVAFIAIVSTLGYGYGVFAAMVLGAGAATVHYHRTHKR